MKPHRIIFLAAIVTLGALLQAQPKPQNPQTPSQATREENEMLKKLVAELTAAIKHLDSELAAEKLKVEKIRAESRSAAAAHHGKAMEYRTALAENKMLKARIRSLVRKAGSSTSKPASASGSRNHVRVITIELPENDWEWWTNPRMLSKHIAIRRKLIHLDADHSIDAWLTRRKEFAGTRVNWTMKLVSGSITSGKDVDKTLKQAREDLQTAIEAAVYGPRSPKPVDNAKYKDGRLAARAATRPAPKAPSDAAGPTRRKPLGYARPKPTNFRKQVGDLQEKIELYEKASEEGGMTTIYAVADDIAVKMMLPGRHFENMSLAGRPSVQVKGFIISAGPKAGFLFGRPDTMMQFVVSGQCELKNPPKPRPKRMTSSR